MICPSCGKEIKEELDFCPYCNHDVKGNQVEAVDESSYFDGMLLQLIGWKWLGRIITLFTLGICYPWAICMVKSWEAKHTVIDHKHERFDGTAVQLFGNYIKWLLLTFITCGIYGFWLKIKVTQWVTKHTFFEEENESKSIVQTPACSLETKKVEVLCQEHTIIEDDGLSDFERLKTLGKKSIRSDFAIDIFNSKKKGIKILNFILVGIFGVWALLNLIGIILSIVKHHSVSFTTILVFLVLLVVQVIIIKTLCKILKYEHELPATHENFATIGFEKKQNMNIASQKIKPQVFVCCGILMLFIFIPTIIDLIIYRDFNFITPFYMDNIFYVLPEWLILISLSLIIVNFIFVIKLERSYVQIILRWKEKYLVYDTDYKTFVDDNFKPSILDDVNSSV